MLRSQSLTPGERDPQMTQAATKEAAATRAGLPGGYAGQLLRVDLSAGRAWGEPWSPADMRTYLGGAGLGAKILWDEVPAGVNWDDPENRLVLGTGPLAGLPVWGTGGLTVVTRGAMTNGGTSTQANGFFGANLKYCGYDAIVVQGQAPEWTYLLIRGDRVELRDARHLVGKDTWETQDALNGELGYSGHMLSVYSIGPAGENLVRFAAIQGDYGHVASKNGVGAVMGKKRLKAVAIVRGGAALRAADPRGLIAAADDIAQRSPHEPGGQDALRVRHAPGRREPARPRRAPDQELHDERGPARRRHEAVGGAGAPAGLRPPRAPVQRLRDAPLPHAGAATRQAQGRDRRRARVRGLVGRRLGDRVHRSRWPSPGSTRRSIAPASTSTSSGGSAAG